MRGLDGCHALFFCKGRIAPYRSELHHRSRYDAFRTESLARRIVTGHRSELFAVEMNQNESSAVNTRTVSDLMCAAPKVSRRFPMHRYLKPVFESWGRPRFDTTH